MQLSCLPVSFYPELSAGRMTLRDWARMGAEIGLDAVDASVLMFPDHAPETLARLRREVEDEGMSLLMLTSYPDFTHPDGGQRARELDEERRVVEMAAALGVRYVRATAGQAHPGTSRAEGIAWAAHGLRRLVELTRGSGVEIVYENHGKPGVWQYNDFTAPEELFLAVFDATDGSGLGINFDTANALLYAADPVDLLREVLSRVRTVHANEVIAPQSDAPYGLLGTGLVPFAALFSELHKAGWDNWICIEECGKQGRAGVEAAARFVRRVWAEAQG